LAEGKITVMLVDDHELVRHGVRRALERVADIEVAAEAADGPTALEMLESQAVDVVLLDMHMPLMSGLECLDRVTAEHPEVVVLMLTIDDSRDTARQAIDRGAMGYVDKSVPAPDLANAIRMVARNNIVVSGLTGTDSRPMTGERRTTTPAAVPNLPGLEDLTSREWEILLLLTKGMTNDQISQELFLAPKTVKYHLTHAYSKLGVRNRTEAAMMVTRHRARG